MSTLSGLDIVPTAGFGMMGALPHPPSAQTRSRSRRPATLAAGTASALRTELLTGNPVDEIVAYADSIDADLHRRRSRGHGAVASALLGSVSQGVLHEARRPVLVFRRARARGRARRDVS